jgi:hypothetical protein
MTQPPDPDDLDWDRETHGKMADYATDPDDEPQTEPYDPEQNENG